MGLWGFVKGKGTKRFGVGQDQTVTEAALLAELRDLGLDASGLEIAVDGEIVSVTGTAVSQTMKEKVILAVGNVAGVEAVRDDVPSETDPIFHTVVPGDTLWAIAKDKLGQGNRYIEIFEANMPMLSHPDKIYSGQVLRLPQG